MRTIVCALLLVVAAGAAERSVVEFKVKADPKTKLRGWGFDANEEGFTFMRFGSSRKHRIAWDALVANDRSDLRRRFKLDLSDAEVRGLVDGHKLTFKGGGSAIGLLVRVDPQGRHWLKRDGLLFPYPRDRIKSVDEVPVDEAKVYSADELYWRRIKRTPPRTAAQHRDLANRMLQLGLYRQAILHYQTAIDRRPAWQIELRGKIAEAQLAAKDTVAADELVRIRVAARVRKDFAGARAMLDRWADAHPDRRRTARALRDEIEELRAEEVARVFHAVKNESFRRMTDHYSRRAGSLEEAMSWVTRKMPDLLRKEIARRLGIPEARVDELMKTKSKGAPHWASYKNGTFAVSKRARTGTSSAKKIRGDPEKWWSRYGGSQMRGAFLRAYAAERLPDLFEIVMVRVADCTSCGGTGQTRHQSVHPLADGGHTWRQLCKRCYGARQDRSVAYR